MQKISVRTFSALVISLNAVQSERLSEDPCWRILPCTEALEWCAVDVPKL